MSSIRLQWDGLNELADALQQLPLMLVSDGAAIVEQSATACAAELRSVYPSGPMRDGVDVADRSTALTAYFAVESKTEQAAWWDYGTQNRQTQKGWNRGAEPAHPDRGLSTLGPKHRAIMRVQLWQLVEQAGFELTESGD